MAAMGLPSNLSLAHDLIRKPVPTFRDHALLRGADIIPHRLGLLLDFPDALLDHVADRHQTDQLALGHHRHVTEFSLRHPLHDAGDAVVLAAGGDVARHHLTDWKRERGGAVFGDRAHDVALRQYCLLYTSPSPRDGLLSRM